MPSPCLHGGARVVYNVVTRRAAVDVGSATSASTANSNQHRTAKREGSRPSTTATPAVEMQRGALPAPCTARSRLAACRLSLGAAPERQRRPPPSRHAWRR